MGNSCCCAFCSSENEIAMDLGLLEEMVQDVTHLDQLLSIIDLRLQAIATNDRAQQNTSTQQGGSSSKFDSCINFGKDLVMKMSKRAERNCCMVSLKSAYNRETRKVVSEVLKGASQIHLLAAGVCVVGYLLDQIEQLSDNRGQCIKLLKCLCALARRVKQLDHRVPAERESLDEAVNYIFDGCVLCLTQMASHRVYRLFQASVDAGDLQKLESQIRNTYADLTLGAVIGVLDNAPRFLPPTQGQDPKPVGREVAKERVIKLLKMDPSDDSKRAVVIYGFGGIGKTTLASAIFKTLDLKAYKFCRLDMDANCSNDDIKRLQQQMLRQLFSQGNVVLDSYVHGQDQLTEAFRQEGGRIFIFIDNALSADNLTKLLPTDLSCLPSGMRILLTTRKLDQSEMLSRRDFERIPYEVDVLTHSDSEKLLFKIALGSDNASLPPGIDSIDVKEIVNTCGGIPLLVELVGPKFKKYLSRASEFRFLKEFLKEFVAAGRDIERVVDEVYKSLDELSKEAFLDIVFFFDKCEERVVSAAVGKVQLEVLLDAALVKLSFEDDELEKFVSIIWGTEDEKPEYFLRSRKVKIHDIIKARGRRWSQQDRILELESLKDALQDRQLPASLNVLSLKTSANLPTSLQSFDNLCSLEYLELVDCDALVRVPTSFGNLESLVELDLSGCGNITTLPENIGNLSALKFLNLSSCTKLASLPPTFGKLESLEMLFMDGCSEFTCFPDSLGNLSTLQVLLLIECDNLVELPKNFGALTALKILDLRGCSNLEGLPESFGQIKSLKCLNISSCENLKTLDCGLRSLTSLMVLNASSCESLDEEAMDILVEMKSLLFVSIDGSWSLIERWEQIRHHYPLIVYGPENDELLHTIEHTLFHGGSRFVGVEGDGGQLVDWSWSCFAEEEEEEEVEVEVSVLLTMCDLSLDCNSSALRIVRGEIERRMEESRSGRRNFQIVYVEAGDSLDKSEEHINQTLLKLLPSCTCACMPVDSRTRQLFGFALYSNLESESRYAIESLHTCIFGLRVRMQKDKKWTEFQSECFPDDYKETLIDREGGFDKLFALDYIYSRFF